LNSTSVTAIGFGAVGAVVGTDAAGAVVVLSVEEALVEVEGVVVSAGVDVDVAFDPSAAWLSLVSRPKKKTANIIPTNRVAERVKNAGRPRFPG
jgi:hypothetical protein